MKFRHIYIKDWHRQFLESTSLYTLPYMGMLCMYESFLTNFGGGKKATPHMGFQLVWLSYFGINWVINHLWLRITSRSIYCNLNLSWVHLKNFNTKEPNSWSLVCIRALLNKFLTLVLFAHSANLMGSLRNSRILNVSILTVFFAQSMSF